LNADLVPGFDDDGILYPRVSATKGANGRDVGGIYSCRSASVGLTRVKLTTINAETAQFAEIYWLSGLSEFCVHVVSAILKMYS